MLAEVEEPLRELTRDDMLFHSDKPQEKAFKCRKDLCCQAPIMAYYDVKKEVLIQCDTSSHAVGQSCYNEEDQSHTKRDAGYSLQHREI